MLSLLNGVDFSNIFQFLTTDFCTTTKGIWIFLGKIISFIQIAVPVLIVLLGTIDLGKAVLSGEDKKVKEAQGVLIRRLIYGVAIFFLVMIVQLVFGVLDDSDANSDDPTDHNCFGYMEQGM